MNSVIAAIENFYPWPGFALVIDLERELIWTSLDYYRLVHGKCSSFIDLLANLQNKKKAP